MTPQAADRRPSTCPTTTPGHWTAGPWTTSYRRVDAPNSVVAHASTEANARLIAAAPELVEALRDALSTHGQTVEQANDGVPLEPWEVLARAALAKARGEATP